MRNFTFHFIFMFVVVTTGMSTNYYCDPNNGSMSNNGSETSKWSTLEAVFNSGKQFKSGDVIYLLNGNHGTFQIKNATNSGNVTITSYSGHNPVIRGITLINSSHWTFDNLRFEGYGLNRKTSGVINSEAGCNYIKVKNSYITSVSDAVVFDYSKGSTEAAWREQTSSGVRILGNYTEVSNCTIYNTHFGVTLHGNDIKVLNNDIDNVYADGIQIAQAQNTIIEGNSIRDFYVEDMQHDDGIQIFCSTGPAEVKNVIIRNNYVSNFQDKITADISNHDLVSGNMQGIIITDGWASGWIVENNIVVNSHTHGFTIAGANNCRIQNNTSIKNPQLKDFITSTSTPIFQTPDAKKPVVKASGNNIIRNNLTTKFATWVTKPSDVIEGNFDIVESDYNNYLACFADYENYDFRLKSTSGAVDYGVNKDLTSTDIDGNARLVGSKVDAGCYEYNSSTPTNSAPVLANIGSQVITVGNSKDISISASDVDGDNLTFSVTGNSNVTIVNATSTNATLRINSSLSVGNYSVVVKVSDGTLNDTETVNITVNAEAVAGQKMNLDAPTADRFVIPQNLVWPTNVGDANVSLWNDDKVAATTITIDDNIEGDHAWWLSMQEKYNIDFTWFAIIGNVTDWSKYQTLIDAGNEIQTHDLATNYIHGAGNDLSDAQYIADMTQARDTINKMLTNNQSLTFAYPIGKSKDYIIRDKFIAMRGVTGVMNHANKINYLDINSRSATNDVNDLDILLDPNKNLWNQVYYRGLASYHYHTVAADKKAVTEAFLSALSSKSNEIWAGKFSEVTRYGQERDTHNLSVDENTSTVIKFTLTDDMNDAYFDFPLTVKVRIDNGWSTVNAVQNGVVVEAKIVENGGNKYALVKAVPDRGQVTLSSDDIIEEPSNYTSNPTWKSFAQTPKTGSFRVNFDATPNNNNVDGVIGFTSVDNASTWSELACIVRFNSDSQIDARNAGSYESTNTFNYVANQLYNFTVDINVDANTYTVYTSIPGETAVVIAKDYSFRTEQQNQNAIDNLAIWSTTSTENYTLSNLEWDVVTSNNAPKLADISDITLEEGNSLNTVISATDDGDALTFSITGNPSFVSLVDNGDKTASLNVSSSSTPGVYNVTVTVTDGSLSDSKTLSITISENSSVPPSYTSGATWQSITQAQKTGSFRVTFDATPNNNNVDGVIGFTSVENATTWSDLACIIRFNNSGQVDARNAGSYESANTMSYVANQLYHFTVDINVDANTYSVYTSIPGESATVIAQDYSFRTEQQNQNALDNVSLWSASSTENYTLSNLVWDSIAPNYAPQLAEIGSVVVNEGIVNNTAISATDGNGDALIFSISGNPSFVSLVDNGDMTASLNISSSSVPGNYSVTVEVTDGSLVDTEVVEITINTVDSNLPTESVVVSGEVSDVEAYDNNTLKWVGQTTVRVGGATSANDAAYIMPFKLPTISAGQVVTSATLNVHLKSIVNSPEGNVDVYGIAFKNNSSVASSEYNTTGTLVSGNAITTSSSIGNVSITSAQLVDYINVQIQNGATDSDYLFLRLSPDFADVSSYKYWEFYTADSGTNIPTLSLEIGNASSGKRLSTSPLVFSEFTVYPNPAKGNELTVKLPENVLNQHRVELINLSGQIVYSSEINEGENSHSISMIDTLNNGVYILRVSDNNDSVIKKVMIK